MYNYSIMPLDIENCDAICEDIQEQYENGIADCVLFKMSLVPEGIPPINKAEEMCKQFDVFSTKLDKLGIRCGILMQSSLGHGYALNESAPFTSVVGLRDGKIQNFTYCPYDKGFQKYIYETMQILTKHNPALIMVDDDFRLIGARSGKGCVCHLHMNEFNKRAGVDFNKEELLKHILDDNNEEIAKTFIDTQIDSLIECAKVMREGIDSINPKLQGAFCCVGNACEGAAEIAHILAGKGNPTIVRINNGNYTPIGTKFFTNHMLRAAIQIKLLNDSRKVDVILAETDTCPQNRYSTSAMSLHSHFVGTILEGASGAKHWITRLNCFEPDSGKAYRKILAKNKGMYEALAEIVPKLHWKGCRIPLSSKPDYAIKDNAEMIGWGSYIFERMGIPMYYSDSTGGAVCIDGKSVDFFSDSELLEFFKGTVILDGIATERVNKRGFIEYTGVMSTPWKGENPSGEILYVNDKICAAQVNPRKLEPINEDVIIDSMVYHLDNGTEKRGIFPGCTIFNNPLGGRAICFNGEVKTEFKFNQAFSFLNESRKAQLIRILQQSENLPIYYVGDEEVYLKVADIPDGGMFISLFNIGFDEIENIILHSEKKVTRIEKLLPDGSRKCCEFEIYDCNIIIKNSVLTLDPQILFLY